MAKTPAWQRKEGKDPEGGLNDTIFKPLTEKDETYKKMYAAFKTNNGIDFMVFWNTCRSPIRPILFHKRSIPKIQENLICSRCNYQISIVNICLIYSFDEI